MGHRIASDHPRATIALVLGILGIVTCQVVAPFALVIGRRAVKEIDASNGAIGGRGLAQAGYILGIIGTVLLGLAVLVGLAPSSWWRPTPARDRAHSTRRSPVGAIDGSLWGMSTTNSVR